MSASGDEQSETLTYAGFWIRVWASIVDSILVVCILVPLILLIPGALSEHVAHLRIGATELAYTFTRITLPMPVQILVFWILPAVAILLFWVYRAATPGKMLISARIVDAKTGNHPGNGQLIGRYLGYFVSTIPLFLGLIWVGIDRRKQGWHDKLANTVVVRSRKDNTAKFNPSDADAT